MKTIEIICKKFEEWDPVTQERILDKHRYINTEDTEWYEYTLDAWAEKLLEMGFNTYSKTTTEYQRDSTARNTIDICFSGFCSQGDGASFAGSVDVKDWIKKNQPEKYAWVIQLMEEEACYQYSGLIRRGGRYHHWNSTNVDISFRVEEDKWPAALDEAVLEKLAEDIEEHHRELNREIYSALEEEYNYLTSDEVVKDTLIDNEYEFDEDGEIR